MPQKVNTGAREGKKARPPTKRDAITSGRRTLL